MRFVRPQAVEIMDKRHHALAVMLAGLASCAGTLRELRLERYLRSSGDIGLLASEAIDRRCPLPGLSAEALLLSFGRPPNSEAADSSGASQWIYVLRQGGPVVRITVANDTVRTWDINARADWGKVPAPPGSEWPRPRAQAVNAYLEIHPETADRQVYAMARGCPQPGMTPGMLEASWGRPALVDSVLRKGHSRIRLIYGFGVEGQNTQFEFESDSLVLGRSCGWPMTPPIECLIRRTPAV
jgi:hypothetical protein